MAITGLAGEPHSLSGDSRLHFKGSYQVILGSVFRGLLGPISGDSWVHFQGTLKLHSAEVHD